jgi:hypothetical protein
MKRVHLNENSKHGEGRRREKGKREDTPYGCKHYHMTTPPSDLQIVAVRDSFFITFSSLFVIFKSHKEE